MPPSNPTSAPIGAFGRSGGVPCPRQGVHGARRAAAASMRTTSIWWTACENSTPPPRLRAQFLRPPRPVQKVGVVERMDHAHPAELAAVDQLARLAHRRVVAVARADQQMDAGLPAGGDHAHGLFHRNRDRLFDQHMFAGRGCRQHVLAVQLVWRRHIDHFDVRVGAQSVHRPNRCARRIRARRPSAIGPRRADCDEPRRASSRNAVQVSTKARPSPMTPRRTTRGFKGQ